MLGKKLEAKGIYTCICSIVAKHSTYKLYDICNHITAICLVDHYVGFVEINIYLIF